MKINWKQLVHVLLPHVLAQVPVVKDHPATIPMIQDAVLQAEQLITEPGSGAQKAQKATALFGDSLDVVNGLRPDAPLPKPELLDAARKGVDATLSTIKAIEKLHEPA